jgi:hypothetical protein
MTVAVKISDDLALKARIQGKALHRSMAGQVEYWAKIGQTAEENPDLPYSFIVGVLTGLEEMKAGQVTPYVFSKKVKGKSA